MTKKSSLFEQSQKFFFGVFILSLLVGAASGAVFGTIGATLFASTFSGTLKNLSLDNSAKTKSDDTNINNLENGPTASSDSPSAQLSVVNAVRKVEPAVVSIVVTKDVPKISQRQFGNLFSDPFFREFFNTPSVPSGPVETERRKIGGGTGFFVSSDGLLLTNKHVVVDEDADYTVLLNDGRELTATILARDPVNDLAVAKVEGSNFPTVVFGDSDDLELGESVIAIGNALGEFRNTVSVGVISGLSRSITASGSPLGPEYLTGVIQTDTAINSGNSGGPLANLRGEVIGINTAVSERGQNIGFAIPSNEVKQIVDSVKKHGRIVRPFLGVRYVLITDSIAKENQLPVDYGALLVRGQQATEVAVTPGSPADKAGLKENDIILRINNEKISLDNPLVKIISRYSVGDEVPLTVLRQGEEIKFTVTLVERK